MTKTEVIKELVNKMADKTADREKLLSEYREEIYVATENHKRRLINMFSDLSEEEVVCLLAADTVGEFAKFNVYTKIATGIDTQRASFEMFNNFMSAVKAVVGSAANETN